jgi:hypothetical protein
MQLAYITFLAFAFFSSLRVVSYLPQILRVAADAHGASAISYSTWGLWTASNAATALYGWINLQDFYLAAVSATNTACCVIVILLTMMKRRTQRERLLNRSPIRVASLPGARAGLGTAERREQPKAITPGHAASSCWRGRHRAGIRARTCTASTRSRS